jgi:hypothetical protein
VVAGCWVVATVVAGLHCGHTWVVATVVAGLHCGHTWVVAQR